jgi:acetyltransferase-like isoleucine patch superfamily enzyme
MDRVLGQGPRRIAELRARLYRLLLPQVFSPGMRVGRGLALDNPSGIRLGEGVIIHNNCMLLCQRSSNGVTPSITVGPKTFMNVGALVAAGNRVTIGEDVGLGPYTCVVDQEHIFSDPHVAIMRQGTFSKGPVVIGDGCWIGTGAVILGDTTLAPGTVVGANSVVRGHFDRRCILAGAPARVVKLLD